MNYLPIESYGIIGDLQTIGLVSLEGSIDFFCYPEFDSPSIFAALLDKKKGGCFKITPSIKNVKHKQMYLPDSNILLSRFLGDEGMAEISDYMVIDEDIKGQYLVRRAKAIRGTIHFTLICEPKFNYAKSSHQLKIEKKIANFFPDEPKIFPMRLVSEEPLKEKKGAVVAEFTLKAGETRVFIFEEINEKTKGISEKKDFVSETFKNTLNFWHGWIRQSNYKGRWREEVNRSALTLKLLTSKKYGSIIAAPTFGLPEQVGSERNWDYRYTWIRDASFTIYALMRLGYYDEAKAFMRWIEDRCGDPNPNEPLQIMYGINGRKNLEEKILSHFEGYKQSEPVRIGNAAYSQVQMDIYGELMDSIYLYNKYADPISIDLWQNLIHILNWVAKNWKQKGQGIWEVRGGKKEFLYSKLMCWVALDRGIRLATKRSFPAPLTNWIKTRDTIYHYLLKNFWNEKDQYFVQYMGGKNLDASALMMPLVKFVGPTDPKWISTLNAIGKNLVDDALVYRYRIDGKKFDGLHGDEGTFTLCSFWYVECLARAGDLKQATFLFEKILTYSNHLGLFGEEIGKDGSLLGNYPQAFTHLSLISAAVNLNWRLEE